MYCSLFSLDFYSQFHFVFCDAYRQSETALRTKHVLPLLERSRRAVLLTGTPCLSRPIELFTQLHALQPQLFIHKQVQ